MSKQLLIYDTVAAVSKIRHRDWSVKAGDNYSFAKNINSVPITAIEFPNVAREYVIVFSGQRDTVFPVAMLGVKNNENMYLSHDNSFATKYLPAYLRRYPFVYATVDNGATLTLCIDESFSGCNQGNIGERLFDANGEQTMYLKNVLGFLNEYQVRFNRTTIFCKKLVELDLLEPMQAQIRSSQGSGVTVTGFLTVNKKRLKALSAEQLQTLVVSDELELIYLHLQSLRNIDHFSALIKNDEVEV
jgi:hypothetical protein